MQRASKHNVPTGGYTVNKHSFKLAGNCSATFRAKRSLFRSVCTLLSVAQLVGASSGCGSNNRRASADGAVTLDGSPIELGTIEFHPSGGNKGPVAGGRIENGYYDVGQSKGPVVGQNTVVIRAEAKTGRKVPSPMDANLLIDEIYNSVPKKYNESSELTVNMKSGRNTFDFALESN